MVKHLWLQWLCSALMVFFDWDRALFWIVIMVILVILMYGKINFNKK